MKIGIDARMYGVSATTGIGFYIQKLIEQLAIIDQKNQYYIFLRKEGLAQFNPPNNRFKKIKADIPWYSYREQTKLPGRLKKYQLDLVHFPHFNIPIFYQRPSIITIHDITPKFFPGPKVKKSPWRKIAYDLVFKNGLRKAKKIITISEHTKQNLIKYFPTNPDKIAVIYLGVDRQFRVLTDQKPLNALKNQYQITKPFLFYVGVWRDHKNLPNLIKAFTLLKSKYQLDIQLVLGGKSDPRYPEINQAINNCPFKNDIIPPGFIPAKQLPDFYNAAKLFVLPSYCEGFGLVAVESAACGTPVAGSKTTSLPEILGEAGQYFNPDNIEEIARVINQILTDANLYQVMRQKGLELVKKYDWQTCAKKTLEIYDKVIYPQDKKGGFVV